MNIASIDEFVSLMTREEFSLTGAAIPTHASIVEPVLRGIEHDGLRMSEQKKALAAVE